MSTYSISQIDTFKQLQNLAKRCLGKGPKLFERRPLSSLALEKVCLAQAGCHALPNATVYMNMAEFDPEFALHHTQHIYLDRIAQVSPIDLVRLEKATIYPGTYIVSTGTSVVEEQMPASVGAGSTVLVNIPMRTEDVPRETVIVARFGAWTWGHWVGELLPKIAVVEMAFPGRFLYAVPQPYGGLECRNFRQSISAYGVASERLVLLAPDRAYTLPRAWAVTSVWSDHIMHPAMARLMRQSVRAPADKKGAAKVALLRRRSAARVLENWDEIAIMLAAEGYQMIDIAEMSFADQLGIFRNVQAVFSTLGSGLTGLIYSPIGVGVTSVAPALFGDRFFYALAADRYARYADVRGPIVNCDATVPHRGSFRVDRTHLAQALAAVK
jgi:capsular polysaccharide biosynthesis protein